MDADEAVPSQTEADKRALVDLTAGTTAGSAEETDNVSRADVFLDRIDFQAHKKVCLSTQTKLTV